MKYIYRTTGVCTPEIEVEIDDATQTILQVRFLGPGCRGNRVGISKLVEGQKVEEVIRRLSGIPCGLRRTSCPDQLAEALKVYLAKRKSF